MVKSRAQFELLKWPGTVGQVLAVEQCNVCMSIFKSHSLHCARSIFTFSLEPADKLLNLWNFIDVLHTNFDRSSVVWVWVWCECECGASVWQMPVRLSIPYIQSTWDCHRVADSTRLDSLPWYWCAKFSRILSLNKTKCGRSMHYTSNSQQYLSRAEISVRSARSAGTTIWRIQFVGREVFNWVSSCITPMQIHAVKSLLAMAGSRADSVWLVAEQKATQATVSSSIPIRIRIRIRICVCVDIDRLSSRPVRPARPLAQHGVLCQPR